MKTFLQEVREAVSNFKFYKQVKDFPLSKCISYILSLVLLVTVALGLRYSFEFKKGFEIAADWAKKNLPVINIQNGIASADVEQPCKITAEDFTVIIDTTGSVISLDEYKRGVLLTKDKVMYKESEMKTESYSLSAIKDFRLDEKFITKLKNNAVWVLLPFIFLLLFIVFSIARFLQILFFSVISVAFSSIANIKLNYQQLFKIGIYAVTPSTILGAIIALLGIQVPFFEFIYSGIYVIYLIIAIKNNRESLQE